MVESLNDTITFPEDDRVAFCLFITWIYSRPLPKISLEEYDLNSFMKAWPLADKLCMPYWQNRLSDRIMTWLSTNFIDGDSILWLLENASPVYMLFQLCWDQFVWELANNKINYYNSEEAKVRFKTFSHAGRLVISLQHDSCLRLSPKQIGQSHLRIHQQWDVNITFTQMGSNIKRGPSLEH